MIEQVVQTIKDWCNEPAIMITFFGFNNEFGNMSKEGSTEAPIRHPIDFEKIQTF